VSPEVTPGGTMLLRVENRACRRGNRGNSETIWSVLWSVNGSIWEIRGHTPDGDPLGRRTISRTIFPYVVLEMGDNTIVEGHGGTDIKGFVLRRYTRACLNDLPQVELILRSQTSRQRVSKFVA